MSDNLIGVSFYDSDFLKIKNNNNLIQEALERLLKTIPGERLIISDKYIYGSALTELLFSDSSYIRSQLPFILKNDIETHLPFLQLLDVNIEDKDNVCYVKLQLFNLYNDEQFDLQLTF